MTKQQLAMQYFPQSATKTAVRHLMRWITSCPQLADELRAAGYRPRNRSFTWRQVELIHRHLGIPTRPEKVQSPFLGARVTQSDIE
ncbi:DUF4248 domain-containing protein [Phocaeicola sp.]|uniref:DUF4248 domain-containing protein n=1 Tax=Phocaeicola sp. TaxID=2773926 RepID=UPI0023CB7661|nr:DUF4248 domain-containing protein [Phocaeicola sp.]MDE5678602.1 DUF4248 domain-containing protein [Phocaeicola sp.]